MKRDTVRINIWVDKKLQKQFKKKLFDDYKTMTQFIIEKIKEYVNPQNKNIS